MEVINGFNGSGLFKLRSSYLLFKNDKKIDFSYIFLFRMPLGIFLDLNHLAFLGEDSFEFINERRFENLLEL